MKKIGRLLYIGLLIGSAIGCSIKTGTQVAKVYKEPNLAKPGSYHLKFLPTGSGTLADYLWQEKSYNPEWKEFEVAALQKLMRHAFPQFYLPVQPGVPLCNLETHYKHCKGVEMLADFDTYADETVVLHSTVYYHITLRLEGDQPNFFRAAKTQRDRGEFALPRHYYVGALVDSIQKALPILQEIATDYRKYIKENHEEIEIELTIEESREKASARKVDQSIQGTAELSGRVILSALPSISFLTGLTVSSLTSGGRTFWEVLKEEKSFDLHRKSLNLHEVNFSYTGSIIRNFTRIFTDFFKSPSDIHIREIWIRLRPKEKKTTFLNPPITSPGMSDVERLRTR